MTTKTLLTLNALLGAMIAVAALVYLFSGRGTASPDRQASAAPIAKVRAGNRGQAREERVSTEPSERVFTDAQWQRVQASDAESQRAEESVNREVVLIATPVAFLEPDPAMVVGEDQARAIQSVRQLFDEAMRTAGDPSSAEYLERWQVEQNRADELLMAYLGSEEFSRFHTPQR